MDETMAVKWSWRSRGRTRKKIRFLVTNFRINLCKKYIVGYYLLAFHLHRWRQRLSSLPIANTAPCFFPKFETGVTHTLFNFSLISTCSRPIKETWRHLIQPQKYSNERDWRFSDTETHTRNALRKTRESMGRGKSGTSHTFCPPICSWIGYSV